MVWFFLGASLRAIIPARLHVIVNKKTMTKKISIREYQGDDLSEVARLFNAYRIFYEQNSDIPRSRNFISDRIENSESVILVADTGEHELAGLCQLYPTFCSVEAAPIYILYDLYVAPAFRRAGVGKALLVAAIDRARLDRKARVDLTTAKDNFGAQTLYESLGWKRDDVFYTYNLAIS
jgi:ribosomal protein S18 acetylase RimI-like enzyme